MLGAAQQGEGEQLGSTRDSELQLLVPSMDILITLIMRLVFCSRSFELGPRNECTLSTQEVKVE